ncbi:uncharacterized protein LOC124261982 isoform X12 [Haliotis rubra]|uniref:uncharacterized protein LOC124261982 isoform X12 n=1 Tax=Haliotis rubra TaxID=36100 RepID=UPI001EE59DF1|nr:uncharacterized protein LOC124261982 isoform X12 [Haliotis rubra]
MATGQLSHVSFDTKGDDISAERMSQFDSLLDFGESTPSETNGTTQGSGAADEFDPFGPSPTIESKGAVDGNLLVDFTADTEISNGTKQNGTSEPFELSFEVSTSNDTALESSTEIADSSENMSSSNPLYDLTTEEPPSNPLYEFESQTTETTVVKSSSQQFENADEECAPSNPLYEFSNNGDLQVETTITTSESASSNPLYDLMSNGNSGFDEQVTGTATTGGEDFLIDTSTTSEQHYIDVSNSTSKQEEFIMNEPSGELIDVIVPEESYTEEAPREPSPEPVRDSSPDIMREPSPDIMREPSPELVREPSPEPVREPTPEPIREPSPEPIREPSPEPIREPSPEPIREPSPEPIREPTPEPIREPSPEPEPKQEVTYRSRSFISLSPSSPNPPEYTSTTSLRLNQSDNVQSYHSSREEQISQDGRVISRSKDEKRYSDSFGDQGDSRVVREVTVQSMGGGSAQQNGYSSNVARETQDREDVHFTEMSSVRNTFESGGPQQTTNVTQSQNIGWEEEEEGVYENQPDRLDNVARESDRDIGAELPEVGMAKNLLSRFTQIASEPKNYKREVTPPRQGAGKIEYESQPASHIQVYEGKAEAGIFESQPQINPDVVRSVDSTSEPLPERGTAKNIASKFKQLESGTGSYTGSSPLKREITPDRATGKVEFVSEPTATIERYEGKAEAGIFENQPQDYEGVVKSGQEVEEILPERGSAKNIAQRFKQMESSPSSAARGKREITPDRNTRGEYVSEPRAHVEMYEGKAEAGVFENRPAERSDVVRSEDILDEPLPERGFARNVASKFREMEHNMKSPPPTPNRVKEITPPREGISSGVYESQPQTSPDVISENAQVDEIVPEKGYARNLVSRFKEIEQENSKVAVSNRRGITPPRSETGVFENQPQEFIPDYNQKIDSGIAENNPEVRSDVAKETDPAKYGEELPERGTARNLVSHWKQVESQSGKQSPGSGVRTKEFTPPREEERVKALRGQLSPGAGQFESVNPNDLPGQYQQQVEPGVFENQPEVRTDVVSEAQTDWTEGMPKENAAKKMVAKFKNIQAEAVKEQPMPVSRKEDGDRQSPENEVTQVCLSTPSDTDSMTYDNGVPDDAKENQEAATPKKKGGFFIPTTPADKCGACQKTVYAMEKFEMNKVIYHKNCFRCTHCKSKLTPKTFAANNGIIYCTNHLMQLFKSKGNYDEGFGREQHKKRWQSDVKDGEQEQS